MGFGAGSQGAPDNSGGTGAVNNPGQGSEGSEYSLSGDFLKGVPDEHKSILEPYVKQWDAGVTRRFQDLHSQYHPYKDLGIDPEVLQEAANLYEMLQDDEGAKQVYEFLHQQYGQGQQPVGSQQQQLQNPFANPQEQNPLGQSVQGLPPEFVEKFEQQGQMLQTLAQIILDQQTSQAQEQEDAELDRVLNSLKEKHGEFDENYVLSQMLAGVEAEQAVSQYMQFVQQITNKANPQPALLPTLSNNGGSGVAEQPQSIKDLSSKDVKNLVANILQQSAQEAGS